MYYTTFHLNLTALHIFSWDWSTWRKKESWSIVAYFPDSPSKKSLHLWPFLQTSSYQSRFV